MYKYKNEHNRQQTDDWLWDTIPNNGVSQEEPDIAVGGSIRECLTHWLQMSLYQKGGIARWSEVQG